MTTPGARVAAADVVSLLQLLRRAKADVDCPVTGASMGEAIPDGATVRIRLDGGAGAVPGDAVALLLAGDTLSVHRLVRRGHSARAQAFVLTHGDGNVFCDAPQRASDLLGTVTAVRRSDHGVWSPVPPHRRLPMVRAAVTRGFEGMMSLALEVSPRLAVAIKNALVLVLTPFVLLRRPAGDRAHRSTSRLVGAQPVRPA